MAQSSHVLDQRLPMHEPTQSLKASTIGPSDGGLDRTTYKDLGEHIKRLGFHVAKEASTLDGMVEI